MEAENIILMSVCLVFFGVRGYLKGLVSTLTWLLAFFFSYVVGFLAGPAVFSWLSGYSINTLVALSVSYLGLFVISSYVLQLILKPILKSLISSEILRWQGALLGLTVGVVTGLMAVWLFSVAKINSNTGQQTHAVPRVSVDEVDGSKKLPFRRYQPSVETQVLGASTVTGLNNAIGELANQLVSKSVQVGLSAASEMNESEIKTVGAFVNSPHVFTQNITALAQSEEIKALWFNPETQMLMATDNTRELVAHRDFDRLVNAEAFQALVNMSYQSDNPVATDAEIAQHLSSAWKRITYLQHDDELQSVLHDPEVQALLRSGNPVALMNHPKTQALVKQLSSSNLDLSAIDFTQYVDASEIYDVQSGESIHVLPQRPLRTGVEVYRWRNESGVWQYTDIEEVPEAFLNDAQRVQ